MNKQVEEAKEIIQKLLEANAELKRKLEENNVEDEVLAKLISQAKEVLKWYEQSRDSKYN